MTQFLGIACDHPGCTATLTNWSGMAQGAGTVRADAKKNRGWTTGRRPTGGYMKTIAADYCREHSTPEARAARKREEVK